MVKNTSDFPVPEPESAGASTFDDSFGSDAARMKQIAERMRRADISVLNEIRAELEYSEDRVFILTVVKGMRHYISSDSIRFLLPYAESSDLLISRAAKNSIDRIRLKLSATTERGRSQQ